MAKSSVPPAIKVLQVIEARHLQGTGTPEDPYRWVMTYYSMDGEVLAEKDTHTPDQVEHG